MKASYCIIPKDYYSISCAPHSPQHTLLPLPAGYFIDKLPAHGVITLSVLYLASCYFLTAFIRQKWQMWLVYGVMTGTAFGWMNLNVFSSAIVRVMPPKRSGLAVGTSTSGSAFGQVVLVPLFAVMEGRYGWRPCFSALAGMTAVVAFPCYFFLQQPETPPTDAEAAAKADKEQQLGIADESGEVALGVDSEYSVVPSGPVAAEEVKAGRDEEEEVELTAPATAWDAHMQVSTSGPLKAPNATTSLSKQPTTWKEDLKHVMSEWRFYGLALAFFVCGTTTTGFLESHMVAYAVDKNYTKEIGASAFSVLSACNGAAMVGAGYLSDKYNPYHLLAAIFFLRGLCYLMLIYAVPESSTYLWLFAVCFGIVDYSVVPPTITLCQKYFPKLVGTAMGFLLLLHSLGAALGSALGGLIYDKLGSYFVALLGCAVACLLTGCTLYYQTAHQPTRNKIYGGVSSAGAGAGAGGM